MYLLFNSHVNISFEYICMKDDLQLGKLLKGCGFDFRLGLRNIFLSLR